MVFIMIKLYKLQMVMQMHVHNEIIAKQWLVCTLTFR